MKQHHYKAAITWTGNKGAGTVNYGAYDRAHTISIGNKPDLFASSDIAFRGDPKKHNPEDLLLSSISACHMLWYLHLCADAGIIVVDYIDQATGIMTQDENGGGRFTEVTLNPVVTLSDPSMIEQANALHVKANELCFIANSLNFPIHHHPSAMVK